MRTVELAHEADFAGWREAARRLDLAHVPPETVTWLVAGAPRSLVRAASRHAESVHGDNGLGWNFRMYNGVGGNTPMDIQSLAPYQVGKWQHVVVVYDPIAFNNATL